MADRPGKILVVDDSRSFIMHVTALLRKVGFGKIVIAENGIEALKILKMWTPGVILLDVNMPEMDGIETLKRIKADAGLSRIPVIMVASGKRKRSFEECLSLGCAGYLAKPFKTSALSDILHDTAMHTESGQRYHLRTPYNREVPVTSSGRTDVMEAVTLSEGGIYLRTEEAPYPVGTEVDVAIPVKDRKPLMLKGNVIYNKDVHTDDGYMSPGMAVEFRDVPEEKSAILASYLTELITGSSRP
jgi:two-component system chemotaxis response regulator CheY